MRIGGRTKPPSKSGGPTTFYARHIIICYQNEIKSRNNLIFGLLLLLFYFITDKTLYAASLWRHNNCFEILCKVIIISTYKFQCFYLFINLKLSGRLFHCAANNKVVVLLLTVTLPKCFSRASSFISIILLYSMNHTSRHSRNIHHISIFLSKRWC